MGFSISRDMIWQEHCTCMWAVACRHTSGFKENLGLCPDGTVNTSKCSGLCNTKVKQSKTVTDGQLMLNEKTEKLSEPARKTPWETSQLLPKSVAVHTPAITCSSPPGHRSHPAIEWLAYACATGPVWLLKARAWLLSLRCCRRPPSMHAASQRPITDGSYPNARKSREYRRYARSAVSWS